MSVDEVNNIKVGVRVRPFNQRERDARSACVVSMTGNCTTLTNPESKEEKTFAFDYSYWSHSDYEESENGVLVPVDDKYADQKKVFDDLGRGILDNAWAGYHATLFAYGQTGAGKSYSVVGYGANKGIVPIACEELFKKTTAESSNDKSFQISYSMLEIYNENVRDLLASQKKGVQQHLKVRNHPTKGFFVEGLKVVPVENYERIKSLMNQGTLNRTTAATNLNATSSRSHMLIRVIFKQVFLNERGESTTKISEINMVDLAGSERSNSAGTSGDRLREGSAINQSLLTLGNVISALAERALKKKGLVVPIPYRDSVLTKLLQSALGGNSKTIMIAALSPAAINYEESLSTLRFADRAKKIKNKAVVNESPTDRLIRELKEENQRLLAQLGRAAGTQIVEGDTIDARRLLEENQRQMEDMEKSWQQKLDEARREWEKKQEEILKREESNGKALCTAHPYLRNVNEDAQLSGVINEAVPLGDQILGKGGGDVAVKIVVRGLGVLQQHALLCNDGVKVTIAPFVPQAKIMINGIGVDERKELQHLDRVKLGSNNLFLYVGFPHERDAKSDEEKIATYDHDYFQSELARGTELLFQRSHSSLMRDVTFMDFLQLLPQVTEVNSMSEELAKKIPSATVKFDPLIKNLTTCDDVGNEKTKSILVRMTNSKTKQVWVWSKGKFINRKYIIEEIYNKFLEGQEIVLEKKTDPFWDPPEDIFLGSCHAWLQPLAYQVEIDDQLDMHGHHGDDIALATLQIHPCDAAGKLLGEESAVLEPSELLDERVDFMLRIPQVVGVRWVQEDKKSRGFFFSFKFFDLPKVFRTKTIWGKNSTRLGFKKQFTIKSVNDDFLEYLQTHALVLELWGTQSGGDVRDEESSSPCEEAEKETTLSEGKAPRLTRQNSDRMMISRASARSAVGFHLVNQREEWEYETLEAEKEELTKRVEELEKEVDRLTQENVAVKRKAKKEKRFQTDSNASSRRSSAGAVEIPTGDTSVLVDSNRVENAVAASQDAPPSVAEDASKQRSETEKAALKTLKKFFIDMKNVDDLMKTLATTLRDFATLREEEEKEDALVPKLESAASAVSGINQQMNTTLTKMRAKMKIIFNLVGKREKEE